ncbi:MAG: hypothetical protein IJ700_02500 [Bacteroidaceae bacterium]|nr:hypothetical protein [Bacteroidaceae bacterium]
MDYLSLLAITSGICSIIGLFIPEKIKSRKWLLAITVFILTFASGYAVHYNSELERVKNVHRQAVAIAGHRDAWGSDIEYIQEVLTFLEENKELYPDAYKRATKIYTDMKANNETYFNDEATELHGIVKSIATLNEGE